MPAEPAAVATARASSAARRGPAVPGAISTSGLLVAFGRSEPVPRPPMDQIGAGLAVEAAAVVVVG